MRRQVRREWESAEGAAFSAKAPRKRGKRHAPHVAAPAAEPAAEPASAGPSEDEQKRLRVTQALENTVKKLNGWRQKKKGFNILQKAGMLTTSADGVRCTVRGSHVVVHGEGGPTTIVRDHAGTKGLTAAVYLRSMKKLMAV